MNPALRILRLALLLRLMSMWLWFALLRRIRPVPVNLNRFAAPRRVFILGISFSYFAVNMTDILRPSNSDCVSGSEISFNIAVIRLRIASPIS